MRLNAGMLETAKASGSHSEMKRVVKMPRTDEAQDERHAAHLEIEGGERA